MISPLHRSPSPPPPPRTPRSLLVSPNASLDSINPQAHDPNPTTKRIRSLSHRIRPHRRTFGAQVAGEDREVIEAKEIVRSGFVDFEAPQASPMLHRQFRRRIQRGLPAKLERGEGGQQRGRGCRARGAGPARNPQAIPPAEGEGVIDDEWRRITHQLVVEIEITIECGSRNPGRKRRVYTTADEARESLRRCEDINIELTAVFCLPRCPHLPILRLICRENQRRQVSIFHLQDKEPWEPYSFPNKSIEAVLTPAVAVTTFSES
ncbi:hypothetical protein HPP92_005405 [Vanilla planifolia]|uniref:Uncharacterized protein n=1 Tax=Vanilla planifolia TaxID=51239 RepID=A0A835VAY8_VANPL|nr:hypothetical protein HPP92_005405 [Vanilla planifolia]